MRFYAYYHNLGEGKLRQLGHAPFPGETPSQEQMEHLRAIVAQGGKAVF